MKKIAHWLFVMTHYAELVAVSKFVKRDLGSPELDPHQRFERACEASGAIYVLEKLDLLADK